MGKIVSIFNYNKKTKEELEREEVIKSIEHIKMKLEIAQTCLEFAIDDALIDSLIYEIISLQKKYDYYLKICKSKSFCVDIIKVQAFSFT